MKFIKTCCKLEDSVKEIKCDWCNEVINMDIAGYYFTVKDHSKDKRLFDFCCDTCMIEYYKEPENPDGN